MKLGTHVSRNNTHIYTKSHNSGLTNYSVIPLFRIKKQTSVGTHSAVLLYTDTLIKRQSLHQ